MAQLIGNGIITLATFTVACVLMFGLNAVGLLRVSKEGELEGLDLHEHGISAYPEYVISATAKPAARRPGASRAGPATGVALTSNSPSAAVHSAPGA